MKLPLRVEKDESAELEGYGDPLYVRDADGNGVRAFSRYYKPDEVAELEAIVAAVNGQAAQERRIAGLLEGVRKSLEFMHWSFCDREIDSDDPRLIKDAMKCQSVGCSNLAAVIRAAAQEEKLAGLLEAMKKRLTLLHWDFCDLPDGMIITKADKSQEPAIYEHALKCEGWHCSAMAAAIRAAGGECG